MTTDSPETSDLVKAVSQLCQLDAWKNPPSKTHLEDWIKTTVANILAEIPSEFWSQHNLEEPGNNDDNSEARFCKQSKCPGDSVLELVLWSRCSKDCHREIKECLEVGAKQWLYDKELTPEHYIQAYTYCIKTHAGYSMYQLGKKFGESYTQKSNAQKEAYCMHQAVMNSSILFRTLTRQPPYAIICGFIKYLGAHSPESKFHGKSPMELDWEIFASNDADKVTHVSIVSWLKRDILIPKMEQVLGLRLMAETKKQVRGFDPETERVSLLERLQPLGDGLATTLQINSSGHKDLAGSRLIGLALLFIYCVDTWTQPKHTTEFDEHLIKVLFQSGMMGNKTIPVVLKYLVKKDSELFPDANAILAVVKNFPRLDQTLLGRSVSRAKVDQTTEEKTSGMEREKEAVGPLTRGAAMKATDDEKAGNEEEEQSEEGTEGQKKGTTPNNKTKGRQRKPRGAASKGEQIRKGNRQAGRAARGKRLTARKEEPTKKKQKA